VHEYPQIDDEAVYAIAQHDAPVLRAECGTSSIPSSTVERVHVKRDSVFGEFREADHPLALPRASVTTEAMAFV